MKANGLAGEAPGPRQGVEGGFPAGQLGQDSAPK